MNLFEFFVKMTHMHIPDCWEETTATFTGRTRRATIRARRKMLCDTSVTEHLLLCVHRKGKEKS